MVERGARTRFLFPWAALRASRAAVLAGVSARALLAPGVVTAAVLGCGPDAQPQLMTIASSVPAVSHVAVCPLGPDRAIDPRVLNRLAHAGIGLTRNADVRQAVFGANLVVNTIESPGAVEHVALARGALLVNASDGELPADLVERVDRIYVDAPDLMAANAERHFVRRHDTAPAVPHGTVLTKHPRGAVVGLGDVLGGRYRCRAGTGEIRLVELLSAGEPDLVLAAALCRAARGLGLGSATSPHLN